MDNIKKVAAGKVVNVQGGKHATYDGLLDLAHKEGLVSLKCRLVQAPDASNGQTAICEAEAVFSKNGEESSWSDIGDANASNTNKMIGLHIIRMASTRAKGRVLRDALNIDGCTADELVDYIPTMHEDGAPLQRAQSPAPTTGTAALASTDQRTKIQMELVRCGWVKEKAAAMMGEMFNGKKSRTELTRDDASRFIENLLEVATADPEYRAIAESSYQPAPKAKAS